MIQTALDKRIRLLLVDSHPGDAAFFMTMVNRTYPSEIEFIWRRCLSDALDCMDKREANVVLLDLNLSDSSGAETLQNLQSRHADMPVILLLEDASELKHLPESSLHRTYGFFVKRKIHEDYFISVIRHAVEQHKILIEVTQRAAHEQIIFHSTRTMIWFKDRNNRILRVNKAAADSIGLSVEKIEGHDTAEFYPEEAEKYYRDDVEVIESKKPRLGITELYQVSPGEKRWVSTDKIPVFDDRGEIAGVMVFATDITEQMKNQQDLCYHAEFEAMMAKMAARFIHLAPEELSDGISATLEEIGAFAHADRVYIFQLSGDETALENKFEWCRADIEAHTHLFKAIPLSEYPWLSGWLRKGELTFVPRLSELSVEAEKEKAWFQLEGVRSLVCYPLVFGSQTVGFLGIDWVRLEKQWDSGIETLLRITGQMFVNALEHKRNREQLAHLTYHDPLTNLPNRDVFVDRVHQALKQARAMAHLAAVFYLDIDHFKKINDGLGHDCGDRLLLDVVQRLKSCLSDDDTITRLWGDEYVILVPAVSAMDHVSKLADKIHNVMKQPFVLNGYEIHLGTCVGIACYPRDGDSAEDLIRHADIAKSHAKQNGRNKTRFFGRGMNSRALEKLDLESRLRWATDHDELKVYYQPQVDIQSGKILGAEALIRWQHPKLGLLPPADFIPLAEESDLIVLIGDWVLEKVCSDMARWFHEDLPPLTVSVNLSPRQFHDPRFCERVMGFLTNYKIPPSCFELEITEKMLIANMVEASSAVRQLREKGIKISIDDFGTGQSSLNYIKSFAADTLKIDRLFIRDLFSDQNVGAILETIIMLARHLHLEIVAEGVETVSQLNFLRAQGCHKVQGYLYSRPLPLDKMTELLKTRDCLQINNRAVA